MEIGFIASFNNNTTHKNDANKKEECEACKKLIELIFGPPTTALDPIEKLQEQKQLHESRAQIALPLMSEHKQSESAVETWSSEQITIPSHYQYNINVPKPRTCRDLEHTELKTMEHLTKDKDVLKNFEPTYEVLSVCAPKAGQELDEFEIESKAAARLVPSTLGESELNEHKCIPAYKYASKVPEPFLHIDGPERFKELEDAGDIADELREPGVIHYEVQSVCAAPSDDVQKETETGTSVVPEGSKTKKHFKCMIPAYEDATKMPEPFLYMNGPECFPELMNKEDFIDELVEPGVIRHEVQSVCAPCKDEIQLEKKMRTIKGVDRMFVLSALREHKPKRKHYKCMIPAYEEATKLPEPFLYINGPEYFQEIENKETITGKQIESGGITDKTIVFAETQQPEINMLNIKGDVVDLISAGKSEPSISKHALKICKGKHSKCIHEIQSVCTPSKDENNLEIKLSKIKGVATRILQKESKPKKHLKCMIPAYEHALKIPEPFLYINGPDDDEDTPKMKRNNKKETEPGKITYEVQSVCTTSDKDKTINGLPLSVMWKKYKGQ